MGTACDIGGSKHPVPARTIGSGMPLGIEIIRLAGAHAVAIAALIALSK